MTEPMAAGPGTTPGLAIVEGIPASVTACCSTLYGSPLAELLVGESFHPGGLESTRQLLAASGLRPGSRLLDAGCGLGASARVAAAEFGLEVDAVDASAGVVSRAAARDAGGVCWATADLLALPFGDATFDAVLAECVLSTLPRGAGLAELRRVTRRGGRLVVSDVETGGAAVDALAGHPVLGAALCVTDAWRDGELEERLGAAGFVLERRWDRSASIIDLVDRVEARIRLAVAVANGSSLDLAGLAAAAGIGDLGAGGVDGVRRLADQVRDAVRGGDLRYFAAVARAAA